MDKLKHWFSILFNVKSAQQGRLPWIDYAKGLAIVLVAYRHILIGLQRSGLHVNEYLVNANEVFYSFRMPLFFILSGIFIGGSLAKRGAKQLMLNKIGTLLYPYLIWAVIQISLQIFFSKYTNANRSLADYGYILIQPDALDQLWYLFALFNVTFIYILLKAFLKFKIWHQLILGVIFHSLSLKFNYGPWHDFLYYYLFYSIGDFISSWMLNKRLYPLYASWKIFLILLIPFVYSQRYFLRHKEIQYDNIYLFALVAIIGCAFLLSICFKFQVWGKLKFMKVIGFHSLYIYVMHVMIVSAGRFVFVNLLGIQSSFLILLFNLCLGIGLSIVIYNILKILRLDFLFVIRFSGSKARKSLMMAQSPAKVAIQNEFS